MLTKGWESRTNNSAMQRKGRSADTPLAHQLKSKSVRFRHATVQQRVGQCNKTWDNGTKDVRRNKHNKGESCGSNCAVDICLFYLAFILWL